jgi:hypothetical protein
MYKTVATERKGGEHRSLPKAKAKAKLSLCLTKQNAMKTYWRSGGIVPRILDLGTKWM